MKMTMMMMMAGKIQAGKIDRWHKTNFFKYNRRKKSLFQLDLLCLGLRQNIIAYSRNKKGQQKGSKSS